MRSHLLVRAVFVGFFAIFVCCLASHALQCTTMYEDAVPLEAGGVAIDLGVHAAIRLADWDGDGNLDLLVGAGDGYVWLFENSGTPAAAVFGVGNRVQAGGADLRSGTENTGVSFVDVTGDGLPDLVVGCCNNQVRLYANTGTLGAPAFSSSVSLSGPSGDLTLPDSCGGRIDVADWDGDGLKDLFAGGFDGHLWFYKNDGSASSPHFAAGTRFVLNGWQIDWPYNIHPKVFDVNQDGLLDLTFGINWGNIDFLLRDNSLPLNEFQTHISAANSNGSALNIRSLIDDDTTPEFMDVNGDGVLDLLSGGFNGKVFVMHGIPYTAKLSRIEEIMSAHPSDLGAALAADASLRAELFGLHHGLRALAANFLAAPTDRQALSDWYAAHVAAYPQYLEKQHLDPSVQPYVGVLASQVAINLFEALPDTPQHRSDVADAIGLTGIYRNIFLDFGVLFNENGATDAEQQTVVYNYLAALPRALWDAESISAIDYFGTSLPSEVHLESRSGVNIFAIRVGQWIEDSFPADSAPGIVDTYSVCLAHEINHTVDATVIGTNAALRERKQTLIEQAAPPDIVFLAHSSGLGIDWDATKARFHSEGYWDGIEANWNSAWNSFWSTGPGFTYNDNWLRNNLQLMIEAPQESFATLSNQYFTNSVTMLDLCIRRWNRGIHSCINQFLFFVDVYSQDSETTFFYCIDAEAKLTRTPVSLTRDGHGHIQSLTVNGATYGFTLDVDGNVTGIELPEDSDGDGIGDSWELLWFGDLTTANATSDYDGDGVLDVTEFAFRSLGFDPTDGVSELPIEARGTELLLFVFLVVAGSIFLRRFMPGATRRRH